MALYYHRCIRFTLLLAAFTGLNTTRKGLAKQHGTVLKSRSKYICVSRPRRFGKCKINPRKFQNDMTTFSTKDDILTLLIHLGYLTFDKVAEEIFIPTQEIAQEFLNAICGVRNPQ